MSLKKTIEKLKEEIKYYEKKLESSNKDDSKAKRYDELEAKNKFLNDTIETMNKNIEDLRAQKEKAINEFNSELDRLECALGQAKCELAEIACDKDELDSKYKRYIEKLKGKLIKMGFKFKSKKKK